MTAKRASRGSVAMLISIADLFFGLAAIIMILIVLSSSTTERLVPDYLDMTLGCKLDASGEVMVFGADDSPFNLKEWLNALSSDQLIQKVGVKVEPGDIGCFAAVQKAFRSHNLALDEKNLDKPDLSAALLIADPENDHDR